MQQVSINGQGIAAITTAWELAARGFTVLMAGRHHSSSLPLVLEENTIELLERIFGIRLVGHPQFRPISGRVIRGWGGAASVVKSGSIGVTLGSLTGTLRSRLRSCFASSVSWSELIPDSELRAEFSIEATGRKQLGLSLGNRVATMASVESQHSLNACILERTDFGWAFLVPNSDRQGTLFGFSADRENDPTKVLESTVNNHFSPERITLCKQAQPWRACSPHLSHPLVTHSEILVGEAAFTFDPICGDGVGYAVRSALLAATAVADRYKDDFRGLQYYSARLHRTFSAHLVGCANMYKGWTDAGWRREQEITQKGITYLKQHKSFPKTTSTTLNGEVNAI